MELFRNTNIDFLGKKWYFLAFSLVFSVAGVLSMLFWHGIPLGVDFEGGTLVYVKFAHPPDDKPSAPALDKVGSATGPDSALGRGRQQRSADRAATCGRPARRRSTRARTDHQGAGDQLLRPGKLDLNNTSSLTLDQLPAGERPAARGHRCQPALCGGGQAIVDYRDKPRAAC